MIEPGMKVVCQELEWYNAHGDEYVIALGERLTVKESYRVGSVQFLRFEEIEATDVSQNPGFMASGFRRSLN